MRHLASIFLVILLTASFTSTQAQQSVWTYHNDNARQGANTNETILTPANVNTNTFGKLFTFTTDGFVYAQPLYMPNVAVTNKGTHNVLFICSEGDTVYAIDADNNTGSNAAPLWQKSMLGSGETTVGTNVVATTDVTPKIGITGTPVIDTNAGTIFLVAKSQSTNSDGTTNFIQRLHALDITSGNERSNSPVVISATVLGTGEGTDGSGHLAFNTLKQHQRSALLLLNGVVYIVWASHGDNSPYHGWLMGYDSHSLVQTGVFNTTPNGIRGGIWHAGNGPVADTNGNIYFVTGNGSYDGATNNDYGDTIIRLSTTNSSTNLFFADYFTPWNQLTLGGTVGADTDLGSGGAMLLPDSVGSATHKHLLVDAGKGKTIYLVDTTNMGHFNPANDNILPQSITNAVGGVVLSTPAFFNNMIYYMSYKDVVKAYAITNGLITTNPVSKSTLVSGIFGATPTITANGTNNAIVWIVLVEQYNTPTAPAVLHAYNAYNLATEYYNSSQAGTRDQPIGPVKFVVPTVVNGKVYVGTQTGVVVFANQSFTSAPQITAQPQSINVGVGSNATFSVGVLASNAVSCYWYFNGTLVPGVTSTNFTITNAQTTNAGYYYVVVSNVFGSTLTTTSSTANLSVLPPLTNNPGAVLAPSGLVDWWPADGNGVDIVGGNNGTLQAGTVYGQGNSGLAFQFNGTTSYVNVGASNLPAPWTACCWANRQNGLTNATILMGDSTYYLKLEQYNNTHQVGITQLGYLDSSFSYIVPTNTWTHLAFVTTTTNVTLYANGVSQGSITTNNFPLPRSYIGAGFAPSRFIDFVLGNLDDLMVYNRALASNEVASISAAGPAGLIRAPLFSTLIQTNGQFTLGVEGLTGKTITISASTNLMTWTSVITLPNATGTNSYTETITNGVTKFYRLTQP